MTGALLGFMSVGLASLGALLAQLAHAHRGDDPWGARQFGWLAGGLFLFGFGVHVWSRGDAAESRAFDDEEAARVLRTASHPSQTRLSFPAAAPACLVPTSALDPGGR